MTQLTLNLDLPTRGNTVLDIDDRLIEAGIMRHRDINLDPDVADAHRGPMLPAAYDWADPAITAGTPVQTWVCCQCGGVAVSTYLLHINHGCGSIPGSQVLHQLLAAHHPGPPSHCPSVEVSA